MKKLPTLKSIPTIPPAPSETQWVECTTYRRTFTENNISLRFTQKKNKAYVCTLRLSADIVEMMGWQSKNKIQIFHDPISVYTWMIKGSNSKEGYSLQKETNSSHYRLTFSWQYEGVTFSGGRNVDFSVHKDRIYLTVPV